MHLPVSLREATEAIKGSDPKAKISPLIISKTATSSVGKGNAKDRDPPSQYHPLS